ncbi:MAG TPA: gliding motility-associated C-terminal domain-containing protein, partial [Chitinophagaceae bacterium]|nr:gliding motility-associated C-terminal domain-containing protein [Chitinophagaceae bacterium]
QYMATDSHAFYGLISVPYDCLKNKYYGIEVIRGDSSQLVELDLENRVIGAVVCKLPKVIWDAASNVDNGNTIGVTIDSFLVKPPCGNETLGSIQVIAHSAASGPLNYVLDDSLVNTTGIFNGIAEGSHSIRITNSVNCFTDSVISVFHGLSQVTINAINPVSCDQQNGSISLTAASGYLPITYKIDEGNFQSIPDFNDLGSGIHTITIRDAGGCEKDTIVYLRYQTQPSYFSSFTVQPTICNGKSGSIVINLPPGINQADVSASLNNGIAQSGLSFQNLDSGTWLVSLFYRQSCRYDTLIQVERIYNERPVISIDVNDQQCLENNGSVAFSINGGNNPYLINFNNTTYSGTTIYSNLPAGSYPVSIQDSSACVFDTVAIVNPYIVAPYSLSVEKTDPSCTEPNTGKIMVTISGDQSPYNFKFNNRIYPNRTLISNLAQGDYEVSILNNDNCVIDTVIVTLDLELTPECEFVFVPNAFTPNSDGLNDVLKPYLGEAIRDFQFAIYNRWGQLTYKTTVKGMGWDGKCSGMAQPGGVYVWTLSYKILNKPVQRLIKGTFVLIR